jgi:predicted  nucleic acid-binding Zn-ribbon protein
MKILQERSELSTKQKELERWEQKVYDKKEELSDLKNQMKEIKDNQIHLSKLKSQLQAQEKQ